MRIGRTAPIYLISSGNPRALCTITIEVECELIVCRDRKYVYRSIVWDAWREEMTEEVKAIRLVEQAFLAHTVYAMDATATSKKVDEYFEGIANPGGGNP